MFFSSSRLCLDVTENTRMNAWPLLMDRRCMAGNWWEPVVSVIWRVQMELLEDITCNLGVGKQLKIFLFEMALGKVCTLNG